MPPSSNCFAEFHKAQALVEAELVDLGGEVEALGALGPREVHDVVHHGFGDAMAAPGGGHGDAADLDVLGEDLQPDRAGDGAVLDGDEVGGGEVGPVELLRLGDLLLDDEDLAAQREGEVAERSRTPERRGW